MVRDPIRMHPRCPSRSCPTIHFVCPVRRRLLLLLLLFVCPFKLVSSQQPPPRQVQEQQDDFHFQYLERPELRWTQQLAGMSVGRFNVIEQSPIDPNILYMTTLGGTLVVLSAVDGSILAEVTPPSNGSTTTTISTNSMSCHSGMAFGIMPDGSQFLVYAVMDNDNRNDDENNNFNHSTSLNGSDGTTGVTSRVVAISLPEHKTLWSSESLPGDSMGSPVILYESTQRIPYVAFTHNTQLLATTTLADDNSTTTVSGSFTLLNASNGQRLWTESASSREEFPQGYGPLGVAVNPIAGNYVGGEDNDNDVLVWGAFDPTGTRRNLGNTYIFQLPPNFQGTETDIQGLSTSILKSVRWTTMTRPVLGDQGRSMYLGVTGDQLRGWTGKNHFDEAADWQADLSVESTDLSSLIPASPALSVDGQRLFVSTSTFSIHGIDSATGSPLWDLVGTSLFQAEPRVSPDNQRVYFAQSLDGQILSIDQQDGGVRWSVSCDDFFDEDCANSVQASFALSPFGDFMYYADIFGKIISLTVGSFVEGEEVPRVSVSVDDPTPSPLPTTSGHSKGAKAASGILAFVISCGIGLYLYLIRRERFNTSRKTRMIRNEPNQTSFHDFFEDDFDFFPTPSSHHIANGFKEELKSFPAIRSHVHSCKERYPEVNALQNHFPLPLQGLRRIAPFEEDYSFGATVLV